MKRATTTFHFGEGAGFRTVPEGKLVADDDPILDVHGGLFADADDVPAEEKPARQRRTPAKAAKKDAE